MGSLPDIIPTPAQELSDLPDSASSLIVPFIQAADEDAAAEFERHGLPIKGGAPRTALLEHHPPQKLSSILNLQLPSEGTGKDGLLRLIQQILEYSVNTWDQGFMDKLYSSTNPVGVVHVYQVSPVLTLIEKHTTRALTALFGFNGPHAGGISQPGGSASNQTSIIIARNVLFPETKEDGNGNRRFVLFTSAHGHYSLEKAAQMFGFGSKAVRSVSVDSRGCMIPSELAKMVKDAQEDGETPFYVNATAGTTVLGSFDPFEEIADVCQRERLWLHIDGSWGGPVVFSDKLRKERLRGCERADSITITPHKMLGVPLTCSFLLGKDIRQFHKANTLPAGYLFHNSNQDAEIYDLADLTPQCGRKGDALKMFLSWSFYGKEGYARIIERSFDTADYLYGILEVNSNFVLVSTKPLPSLQVCFYWAQNGQLHSEKEENSKLTERIAQMLVPRGFMIDFAPGNHGTFFRVVIGRETRKETVERLVKAIEQLGQAVDGRT